MHTILLLFFRRKNSPDELPFPITDELIKLPGYKPKMPPLISFDMKPVLPPKINNNRQRRHSDTVTTLTDSSASADLLEDPIVQERLRPRNNSVANALYDRYVYILHLHEITYLHNNNNFELVLCTYVYQKSFKIM